MAFKLPKSIIEIEWTDAQSSTDAIPIEELKQHPLIKTKSVGYLLHQDQEKIILGFMDFGEGLIKHYQIIPIGMVKSIRKMKVDRVIKNFKTS